MHPRTRARLDATDGALPRKLMALDPLSYLDFIALEESARLVVTDSGGVQEETTAMGVPCLTYRTTTERPITVERGTNRVVGLDPDLLGEWALRAIAGPRPESAPEVPLWDGLAGERAACSVASFLGGSG
jgi:UDP-N-acetylglucosamine 2-epimerase (non-hydrolysing)